MKYFACAFALVWSYHVVRADEPPPRPAAESPSHDQRLADLKLLHEKLEELRNLQVEVDVLRQRTRDAASIRLDFQIAEVSRANLAADVPGEAPAGSLIERLTTDGDTRGGAKGILSESGKKLFDNLRSQATALKVIAEPSIVTIAERLASMRVGGELPVPASDGNRKSGVRYLRYGTSIDVVPIVLGDEKLRLELRLQLSHLDSANSIEIAGNTYPGLVSRSVDFAAEVPVGQTMVVILPFGGRQARPQDAKASEEQTAVSNSEAVETLVLVTPRWVEPMVTARPVKPIYGLPKLSAPYSDVRAEPAPFQIPSYRVRR